MSARIGPSAAELLRAVGLLADGPAAWGRPVAGRGPGVYLVELPDPPPTAPLELARVGKWLERLPGLRLHGERPTSKALAVVLAGAWLPGQPVLYAGATTSSIGARVAALQAHVPGDRRPHPDGQWLHLLAPAALVGARVWWAATDDPELYVDALLDGFADGAPDGALPWANSRSPGGRRRETGITGSLLPAEEAPPVPPARVVVVPDGDAEGARVAARGSGTTRRTQRAAAASADRPKRRAPEAPAPRAGTATGTEITAEGRTRLEAELDALVRVRRPEVVARIRAAKELGDLRENADYTAAREEQSFLEGRIQAIEARLRTAVVADASAADGRAVMGSTLRLDHDGDEVVYTIVGAAESDPGAGRISVDSPVGKALVGARPGDEVTVRTPRGEVRYRVIELT